MYQVKVFLNYDSGVQLPVINLKCIMQIPTKNADIEYSVLYGYMMHLRCMFKGRIEGNHGGQNRFAREMCVEPLIQKK